MMATTDDAAGSVNGMVTANDTADRESTNGLALAAGSSTNGLTLATIPKQLVTTIKINQTNVFTPAHLTVDAFKAIQDKDLALFKILMGANASARADEERIVIPGDDATAEETTLSGHDLNKEIIKLTAIGRKTATDTSNLAKYNTAFASIELQKKERLEKQLRSKLTMEDQTLPDRYHTVASVNEYASADIDRIVRDVSTNSVPLDATDRDGHSLLYRAVESGQLPFAKLLILMGANLDYRPNSNAKTPRDLISGKGDQGWTDLLAFAPATPATSKKELGETENLFLANLEGFCTRTTENHLQGWLGFKKTLSTNALVTLDAEVTEIKQAIATAKQTNSLEVFGPIVNRFGINLHTSGDNTLKDFRFGIIQSYEGLQRILAPASKKATETYLPVPEPATTPLALPTSSDSVVARTGYQVTLDDETVGALVAQKVDQIVAAKLNQIVVTKLDTLVQARVQALADQMKQQVTALQQTTTESSVKIVSLTEQLETAQAALVQSTERNQAALTKMQELVTANSAGQAEMTALLTNLLKPNAAPTPTPATTQAPATTAATTPTPPAYTTAAPPAYTTAAPPAAPTAAPTVAPTAAGPASS